MIYAGIGSRSTPQDALTVMEAAGAWLGQRGWTLRTGGADGADSAFLRGAVSVRGKVELYLPWPDFGSESVDLLTPEVLEVSGSVIVHEATIDALMLAAQVHPNWKALTVGGRKLHGRNCHQVMGYDLATPATMVLCWTPGASGRGGTSTAIQLARQNNVPVFDLGRPAELRRLREKLV